MMTSRDVKESQDAYWKRLREADPYRGLGRLAPHIMPMLGQFVCFKLDMTGRILCAGSGRTPLAAYCAMNLVQ